MRRFIQDVKPKVLIRSFSLNPQCLGRQRQHHHHTCQQDFGLWAKQVAEEQHVPFIDLNDISARKFEKFGRIR